jgi:cellulose 1,4-beta-cellobiosidase
MSTAASVAGLPALVQEARIWEYRNNKEAILQLVVYNLPDRDCSAKASEGEFKLSDGGLEKYRAYIDSIAGYLKNYSDMRFALVLEPDGLVRFSPPPTNSK